MSPEQLCSEDILNLQRFTFSTGKGNGARHPWGCGISCLPEWREWYRIVIADMPYSGRSTKYPEAQLQLKRTHIGST